MESLSQARRSIREPVKNNKVDIRFLKSDQKKFPPNTDRKGMHKFYVFCIILNGFLTLKVGITSNTISGRAIEYHNSSKESKKVKQTNPILLAVMHFPNSKTLSNFESLIKGLAECEGLNLDGKKEVYQLEGMYKLFEGLIPRIDTVKTFISPYLEDEIREMKQYHKELFPEKYGIVPSQSPRTKIKVIRRKPIKESPTSPVSSPPPKRRTGETDTKRQLFPVVTSPRPCTRTTELMISYLNNLEKKEIVAIHGIGKSTAEKIVQYRMENPFKSIEQIKCVKGIGDSLQNKIITTLREKANLALSRK